MPGQASRFTERAANYRAIKTATARTTQRGNPAGCIGEAAPRGDRDGGRRGRSPTVAAASAWSVELRVANVRHLGGRGLVAPARNYRAIKAAMARTTQPVRGRADNYRAIKMARR